MEGEVRCAGSKVEGKNNNVDECSVVVVTGAGKEKKGEIQCRKKENRDEEEMRCGVM